MRKSTAKYVLPLPAGGALGWAAGVTSGGTIPSAWTWSAVGLWASVPLNWAPLFVAAGTAVPIFFGLRAWLDDDPAEARDRITHKLLTGTIADQAEAAIEAGTMSPEQLKRLAERLKVSVMQQGDATAEQADRFVETTVGLARSEAAADRRIAGQVIEGSPEEAADALVAEARAGKRRNAERFRQAARLYAPFAPSKAMEAYQDAVDLDPADVWSWIELGRLRRHYGTLADTRTCLGAALQHATGERDRMVLHNEFGDLFVVEGELPEARSEFESGLAIVERLARQEPGNTQWQRDLSVGYNKLGDVEVASGNLGAARGRFEEGLAIRERLARQEPGNTQWQRDLSVSCDKLGDVEVASGNLGAARGRFGEGLAIAERLARQEPGNTEWQRDLSVSYDRLGDVEAASGNLGAARGRFEEGLAIRERLVLQEPGNTLWQRDLSVSYDKLGDLEVASGNLGAARGRFEEGLAIAERLARQEPGNTEWQRDLSVGCNKLGDVEVTSGNLGAARGRFEEGLAIRERLARQEPGNTQWQRDLSVSYERLGDVEVASGNPGAARWRFEEGLAIRERLARQEPGNAEWQRDLFVSETKLAKVEIESQPAKAMEHLAVAEQIIVRLAEKFPDHPGFARDLAWVRSRREDLGG